MESHSSIVPGNMIDKIDGPHQYEEDEDIMEDDDEDEITSDEMDQNAGLGQATDQSLSMDLTMFARDLQGYYNRIHSEIAQLKDILLRT